MEEGESAELALPLLRQEVQLQRKLLYRYANAHRRAPHMVAAREAARSLSHCLLCDTEGIFRETSKFVSSLSATRSRLNGNGARDVECAVVDMLADGRQLGDIAMGAQRMAGERFAAIVNRGWYLQFSLVALASFSRSHTLLGRVVAGFVAMERSLRGVLKERRRVLRRAQRQRRKKRDRVLLSSSEQACGDSKIEKRPNSCSGAK